MTNLSTNNDDAASIDPTPDLAPLTYADGWRMGCKCTQCHRRFAIVLPCVIHEA